MVIKHNTGYDHINIWRREWAVESQKVLHIFKDGSAPIKTEHGVEGLEIIQVCIKQGNTTIATVDFRECNTADILINSNTFGNITLRFEYIYYYEAMQQPYVIDTYTEVTLTINQKTIVNTDVIPTCSDQIVRIDDNTILFTPPTCNIISYNTNYTIIWGYKSENERNFSIRINDNNNYINLTTRTENYGLHNTKTRYYFTTINKNNALLILNGAQFEILDENNNVIWSGQNIKDLNILNTNYNTSLVAQYCNYSTNNTNPFYIYGILDENAETIPTNDISKRYIVETPQLGIKNKYNDLSINHIFTINNLTMYDIWFYSNLLACTPRYLLNNHLYDMQNNTNIYIVKKWAIKQPTDNLQNGSITITLKRYGNN